jgi:hypothetical protein
VREAWFEPKIIKARFLFPEIPEKIGHFFGVRLARPYAAAYLYWKTQEEIFNFALWASSHQDFIRLYISTWHVVIFRWSHNSSETIYYIDFQFPGCGTAATAVTADRL